MHLEHSLMLYKTDDALPFQFYCLEVPQLHTPFGLLFQFCLFAWKNFAAESLNSLYFLLFSLHVKQFLVPLVVSSFGVISAWGVLLFPFYLEIYREQDQGNRKAVSHQVLRLNESHV